MAKKTPVKSLKPKFEEVELKHKVSSYIFLGAGPEKWEIKVHLTPQDFPDFLIKLEVLVLSLLQNPHYRVPNPWTEAIMKEVEKEVNSMRDKEDPNRTRYIG
jgi:hypothetical protein